jgi:fumarylacetoacetate (FAA) hydrolase family protein
MLDYLTPERTLPADGTAGTLVGRVHLPGPVPGPAVVAVRDGGVFDLTARAPTLSLLTSAPDPLAIARDPAAPRIGDLAVILENSAWDRRDAAKPWLLAITGQGSARSGGTGTSFQGPAADKPSWRLIDMIRHSIERQPPRT